MTTYYPQSYKEKEIPYPYESWRKGRPTNKENISINDDGEVTDMHYNPKEETKNALSWATSRSEFKTYEDRLFNTIDTSINSSSKPAKTEHNGSKSSSRYDNRDGDVAKIPTRNRRNAVSQKLKPTEKGVMEGDLYAVMSSDDTSLEDYLGYVPKERIDNPTVDAKFISGKYAPARWYHRTRRTTRPRFWQKSKEKKPRADGSVPPSKRDWYHNKGENVYIRATKQQRSRAMRVAVKQELKGKTRERKKAS